MLSPTHRIPNSILATLVVVLIVIGIGLFAFIIKSGATGSWLAGDSYEDGFRAAREMAKKQNPIIGEETHLLSGKITAINSDSITLAVEGLFIDERVDGVGSSRTVRITQNTKIVSRTPVALEEVQKQLQARAAAGAEEPTPLSLYTETTLQRSDLKVGDRVSVQGTGEDLTLAESFDAAVISRNVPPETPEEEVSSQ